MRMYEALRSSSILPPLPNQNVRLNEEAITKYTKGIHAVLEDAVVVECSNVADYFVHSYCNDDYNTSLFEDLRVVCPPFRKTFYEWRIFPEALKHHVKRMGLLVLGTEATEAEDVIRSYLGDRANATPKQIKKYIEEYNPHWIMLGFLFVEFKTNSDPENVGNVHKTNFRGPYGTHVYAVSEEGDYLNSWVQFTSSGMSKDDEHTIAAASMVGVCAMSMLNCKNIITRTNKPDAKLQKSRRKKGKAPLMSYKTIHVDPNQKTVAAKATGEGNEDARTRKVVHGHMKDYRAGKGLFGKYKGVYYWGPQLADPGGVALANYVIDKKEDTRPWLT